MTKNFGKPLANISVGGILTNMEYVNALPVDLETTGIKWTVGTG